MENFLHMKVTATTTQKTETTNTICAGMDWGATFSRRWSSSNRDDDDDTRNQKKNAGGYQMYSSMERA